MYPPPIPFLAENSPTNPRRIFLSFRKTSPRLIRDSTTFIRYQEGYGEGGSKISTFFTRSRLVTSLLSLGCISGANISHIHRLQRPLKWWVVMLKGEGVILLNFRQLPDRLFRFTLRPAGLLKPKFFRWQDFKRRTTSSSCGLQTTFDLYSSPPKKELSFEWNGCLFVVSSFGLANMRSFSHKVWWDLHCSAVRSNFYPEGEGRCIEIHGNAKYLSWLKL